MENESPFTIMTHLIFDEDGNVAFNKIKAILQDGVSGSEVEWRELLSTIGTDESYYRCEGGHAHENILFALYEMVDRAFTGKPFTHIGIWEDAIGYKIDEVYLCSDAEEPLKKLKDEKTAVDGNIVLCSGENALILEDCIHIYICSKEEALSKPYVVDFSDTLGFCKDTVISDIRFSHRTKRVGKTGHSQPRIEVLFENRKLIHCSTDFGEVPKEETSRYFQVADSDTFYKVDWKFCVVGNIVKTHFDENGVLRYGTSAFPGGTKVYLEGRFWDKTRPTIAVVGLGRSKKYEVSHVSPNLIENVRCARAFHPAVLSYMNNWEFWDCWWGRTKADKKDTERFVKYWYGEE